MTDFEPAAINAVGNVLHEDVRTRCCFFHLCQSTWRKIQSLGLVSTYKDNCDFRLFVGKLDGLAFLPVEDVGEGMSLLRSTCPQEAVELVDYFDGTYVTGTYRRVTRQDGTVRLRRCAPAFTPPLERSRGNPHWRAQDKQQLRSLEPSVALSLWSGTSIPTSGGSSKRFERKERLYKENWRELRRECHLKSVSGMAPYVLNSV